MKTINNYRVINKKVLLRVDLNVPVIDGNVTDRSRILSIKPTIEKLLKGNNKIFLLSHFGRPKGKYNKKFSLEFITDILCDELKIEKINFIKKIEVDEIKKALENTNNVQINLFENTRFYLEEEENSLNFCKMLSKYFDIYINDAFSASHREHASIVGITNFLPSLAGYGMMQESKNLNKFIDNPKKPNTAIIGGFKTSTKINILHNLIENFDNVVIGGAMANTFLVSQGYNVGISPYEKNLLNQANEIVLKSQNLSCNLILPIDVVSSNNIKDTKNIKLSKTENILPDQMILDIGDKTIKKISNIILKSNMILWNGPLGAFEYKPFDNSTLKIANLIKKNSKILNIMTLAGGGDTISAIKMAKAEQSFTYISNAGGAFLEWLEGKESPGFRALRNNKLS